MPTFYLDTSALLKRYRTEEGTPVIDHLFKLLEQPRHKVATSFLTILEVIAAGRRLLKGRVIEEEDFTELMKNFLTDVNRYFVLRGLDVNVFIRAIALTLAHSLRTMDALQLATALELKDALALAEEELILLVDDQELYAASKQVGLKVINPREDKALQRLSRLVKTR